MWIFGYGSLMWKTNFPYEEREIGFIVGFVRRFWQGSEDHRGVPGAPGRVVTIIQTSDPKDRVYGIAYKIAEKDIHSVKQYLDYREKDGYHQKVVTFHPCDKKLKPFDLSIYIGDANNPFYLGPAPLSVIAEQIYTSEGPSGRNDEYLFQLAETMKKLLPNVYDDHLYELEALVTKIKINES